MKPSVVFSMVFLLFFSLGPLGAEETFHRIGGGVTYWVSLKDIPENKDWDRSRAGYVVTYQYQPALFGLELAVDILPDRFGENTYSPHALLFIGRGFFVAGGIGIAYANSSFADQPFYVLKGGVNWELLPHVHLELAGQYRFNEWADLENEEKDFDTDTVFLGGAVRFAF